MLKFKVSSSIFSSFKSAYQSYHHNQNPFVYVDQEGNIKLLTDVVSDDGKDDGIFAVGVAEDGWMEFLALD
ncbi:MAG: hypothetical protein N4A33_09635 [Bacteriovoracaceae bacterium]|nr:hypothetical protein [Bacteriovoracaceae bacterium]